LNIITKLYLSVIHKLIKSGVFMEKEPAITGVFQNLCAYNLSV